MAVLLSRPDQRRALEIAASITCPELTIEPRYFEEYTAALFLPHTDPALFPTSTIGGGHDDHWCSPSPRS